MILPVASTPGLCPSMLLRLLPATAEPVIPRLGLWLALLLPLCFLGGGKGGGVFSDIMLALVVVDVVLLS